MTSHGSLSEIAKSRSPRDIVSSAFLWRPVHDHRSLKSFPFTVAVATVYRAVASFNVSHWRTYKRRLCHGCDKEPNVKIRSHSAPPLVDFILVPNDQLPDKMNRAIARQGKLLLKRPRFTFRGANMHFRAMLYLIRQILAAEFTLRYWFWFLTWHDDCFIKQSECLFSCLSFTLIHIAPIENGREERCLSEISDFYHTSWDV